MTPLILGFDPSLTAFGMADGIVASTIATFPTDTIQSRCAQLFSGICEFHGAAVQREYVAFEMGDAPVTWFVEAPTLGMNANHLYEVGWIMAHVYDAADACAATIVEVQPAKLKKFIAGAGNADKVRMALAVQKRYGIEFADDRGCNKLDAFCLYKYGCAVVAGEIEHVAAAKRGKGREAKAAVRKRR